MQVQLAAANRRSWQGAVAALAPDAGVVEYSRRIGTVDELDRRYDCTAI